MNTNEDTHRKSIGYILWLFGFTGSHRFYYGYPVLGTIYFLTLGLLFIGWIIDLFLIPSMDRKADIVDVFRVFRNTSDVYGKMDNRDFILADPWVFRYRCDL